MFCFRAENDDGRLDLEEWMERSRSAVSLPASLTGIQFPSNHYNKAGTKKGL